MAASSAAFPSNAKAPVLNSWKEIASYMGRGVRTVQRYERDFRLPVRRLGGKSRKAVLALPQDLDAWLRSASLGELDDDRVVRSFAVISAVRQSISRGTNLREQCHQLCAAHSQVTADLIANLSVMVHGIEEGSSFKINSGAKIAA